MDNRKILRLLRYILAGITFIFLCFILLKQVEDPDFFWHLATGRWIVENLSLPAHDPFSYTTPALLSSKEYFTLTSYWLSQILYYGIYYVSGWNGFIILRFVILGAIIYFVYKRAEGSNRTILFSVMVITSVVFVQMYTFERPHVFSFLFFAILLYLLENLKKACSEQRAAFSVKEGKSVHATRYTLLPLLMLFWANMHGGYIIGQVVILVYLISEGIRFLHPSLKPMGRAAYQRFLIVGISGIIASLINPNTYKAMTFMLGIFESYPLYNTEFFSTVDFFRAYFHYGIPVYWLLLLVASIILLYRVIRKRFDVLDIVMLAGLGYFSFTTMRYMAFFLIWAAPFIAVSLTRIMEGNDTASSVYNGRTVQKPLWKYIIVILAFFIVVVLITGQKEFDVKKNMISLKEGRWVSDIYPKEAVDFIKENDIKGNMYNHYDWGGYLIWRFYPEKKVFVDGRDLYGFKYLEWVHIFNATIKPEVMGMLYYKALLESYKIRYILIPLFAWRGEMLPVVSEMIKDNEWFPVFLSGNSMIFVKDTPENHDLIKRYAIPPKIFVNKLSKMINKVVKGHHK